MTTSKTTRNDQVIEMRNQGHTLQEISDKFCISIARVAKITGNTGNVNEIKINNFLPNKNISELSALDISKATGLSIRYINKSTKGKRLAVDKSGGKVYQGYIYEKIVSEKLTSFGIDNELMPINYIYDIQLKSGIRIDVKGASHKLSPPSQRIDFFQFGLAQIKKKGKYCDFFVFYIAPFDVCFVVPFWFVETQSEARICYPYKYENNKFSQYENNFKLLL